MKTVIFLGCKRVPATETDDTHWMKALEARGYTVTAMDWMANLDEFPAGALVLLRTPWDYFDHLPEFLAKLQAFEKKGLKILNPLATVKTNYDKAYLKTLSEQGIATLPSYYPGLSEVSFEEFSGEHPSSQYLIKPRVGAGGFGFEKMTASEVLSWLPSHSHEERPVFIQPVLSTISSSGERSLIFCAGKLSHAVKKLPIEGEIRIQEEWGGSTELYEPTDKELRLANLIVERLASDLLYSRVDLVTSEAGEDVLMEVELIEPSLYFRKMPAAAETFSDELARRF